jgi:hypothetical protein
VDEDHAGRKVDQAIIEVDERTDALGGERCSE